MKETIIPSRILVIQQDFFRICYYLIGRLLIAENVKWNYNVFLTETKKKNKPENSSLLL